MLASERYQFILKQLQEHGRVRVHDLSRALNVSDMTIYRDLKQLEARGALHKVFGGAVAIAEPVTSTLTCAMCTRLVPTRTAFVIQCTDGRRIHACCPHCGLMLLGRSPESASALAADFLYGYMVNVQTAAFLVNSDLTLCCTPGVFCFSGRTHAEKFQRGFGGEIHNWQSALKTLSHQMSM